MNGTIDVIHTSFNYIGKYGITLCMRYIRKIHVSITRMTNAILNN